MKSKNSDSYRSRNARAASHPVAVDVLEGRLFLSASSPDTSFNGTGFSAASTFGTRANFTATTVLPDGKTLAAGTVFLSPDNDFLVARYTVGGKLDTTFGGGDGWASVDFGSGSRDSVAAIVQLPGGKFALAGEASPANSNSSNFAVARFNADGTADTSFSGDGRLTTSFAGVQSSGATAAAVLSDGKLLVVGNTDTGGDFAIAVAKYKTDGTLDAGFSGDGKVVTDIADHGGSSPGSFVTALAVQADGKFVVAGEIDTSGDSGTGNADYFVARFGTGGSLDGTFGGGDGWVQATSGLLGGHGVEFFTSVAIQRDGKIVAGGTFAGDTGNDDGDFALMRFNTNGGKDTSFGTGGFVRTDFVVAGNITDDVAQAVVLQPDGKVMAVGYNVAGSTGASRLALARYNANGSLDTSFSSDGKSTFGGLTKGFAAAVGTNGKLAVAGIFGDTKACVGRFALDDSASASIAGTVYNDANGNGAKNAGEGGLAGWQVFIDSNNDGFLTAGEHVATTNASGAYTLTGLLPGTFRVREVRPNNYNRTQPAGAYPLGYYDVTLGVGSAITGKNFGNKHV